MGEGHGGEKHKDLHVVSLHVSPVDDDDDKVDEVCQDAEMHGDQT